MDMRKRKSHKVPPKAEVTGRQTDLQNGELHNFHYTPNVIRVVKSRMVMARRVTHSGEIGH
jgi:hypothetical protein